MNVLVTGGLGFIGSHLVDRLLAEGHTVTIVDSCISNVMQPQDYAPTAAVVTDPVENCLERLKTSRHPRFHHIYHLASLVGPAGVLGHAGKIAPETLAGVDVVNELALDHDARLLVASTSEIYGRPGVLSETDDAVVPARVTVRLEYGVAKLTAEVCVLNRAKITPLHVNVVRPFNVTGPRQLAEGGFVLPRFVIAALQGEPITVFGTGQQIRSFTDVRDTVDALMAVQASPDKGQVYNVGNAANEVTIETLATRVKALLESPSSIVQVDPKVLFGPLFEESFDRVPNARKAVDALGWHPAYTLDQTVLDTAAWFRQHPRHMESFLKLPAVSAQV